MSESEHPDLPEIVEIPIDGVLDLHTFQPSQIGDLVRDYLAACQEKGLLDARIIHGKGRGQLLRSVHSILRKHPEVTAFSLATPLYGGEGATVVRLRTRPNSGEAPPA